MPVAARIFKEVLDILDKCLKCSISWPERKQKFQIILENLNIPRQKLLLTVLKFSHSNHSV